MYLTPLGIKSNIEIYIIIPAEKTRLQEISRSLFFLSTKTVNIPSKVDNPAIVVIKKLSNTFFILSPFNYMKKKTTI